MRQTPVQLLSVRYAFWDCMALTKTHYTRTGERWPACCIITQAESRGTPDSPACLIHTTPWRCLTTGHLTAVATPRGGRTASGFVINSRERPGWNAILTSGPWDSQNSILWVEGRILSVCLFQPYQFITMDITILIQGVENRRKGIRLTETNLEVARLEVSSSCSHAVTVRETRVVESAIYAGHFPFHSYEQQFGSET